jgi:hypothetical protein
VVGLQFDCVRLDCSLTAASLLTAHRPPRQLLPKTAQNRPPSPSPSGEAQRPGGRRAGRHPVGGAALPAAQAGAAHADLREWLLMVEGCVITCLPALACLLSSPTGQTPQHLLALTSGPTPPPNNRHASAPTAAARCGTRCSRSSSSRGSASSTSSSYRACSRARTAGGSGPTAASWCDRAAGLEARRCEESGLLSWDESSSILVLSRCRLQLSVVALVKRYPSLHLLFIFMA